MKEEEEEKNTNVKNKFLTWSGFIGLTIKLFLAR